MNFFGNSHSKITSERGIRDFDSGLFQSATELQLRLLDLHLDQLVEGSDVGKLLNLPPSLAMLNSHSKRRGINFVIKTVFAQEKSRSDRLRFMMGPSTRVY